MTATDCILAMDFILMERGKRCFPGFSNGVLTSVTQSFSRLRFGVCFLNQNILR